jgi:hypothetical protein
LDVWTVRYKAANTPPPPSPAKPPIPRLNCEGTGAYAGGKNGTYENIWMDGVDCGIVVTGDNTKVNGLTVHAISQRESAARNKESEKPKPHAVP